MDEKELEMIRNALGFVIGMSSIASGSGYKLGYTQDTERVILTDLEGTQIDLVEAMKMGGTVMDRMDKQEALDAMTGMTLEVIRDAMKSMEGKEVSSEFFNTLKDQTKNGNFYN